MSRSTRSLLHRPWYARRAPRSPLRRPRARPRVEPLEDRTLLAFDVVGLDFLVNSSGDGEQAVFVNNKLAVAAAPGGEHVVAWTRNFPDDPVNGADVFARRFADDGTPLGDEFRVNTFTDNFQGSASVAVDARGNFVIAWTSVGQEGGGTPFSNGVFARRFAADGSALGDEFQVNTFVLAGQARPSVAATPDGRFVIAWQSNTQDGDGLGIFARRFGADGLPDGAEEQVNVNAIGDQDAAAVAVDDAGNYVVAWQSAQQDGSGLGVYARAFGADGATLTGEIRVNTFTAGNQQSPSVAVPPGGGFVVAYHSFGQDSPNSDGVFARQFDAAGSPVGREFQVNDSPAFFQRHATVDVDAQGRPLVTWSSFGQDGDGWGIFGRQFDASGDPLGNEFAINATTAGTQIASSVALDAGGNAVVVWGGNGPGDPDGIFRQMLAPSDEGSNNFNAAPLVQLFSFRETTQAGSVDAPGDVDVFRIIAPVSGPLDVRLTAPPGSPLDSFLAVFDGDCRLVALDDNGGGGPDSRLSFGAVAGETFFIVAAAADAGTGAYELTLAAAVPSPLAVALDEQGLAVVPLRVDESGRLDVRVEGDGRPLRLSLLDGEFRTLVQSVGGADDGAPALGQHLVAELVAEYFLVVEAPGGGPGTVTLSTRFAPALPPFRPAGVGHPALELVPSSTTATDLNGDGLPDLVSTNITSNDVSIFLGTGTASFRDGGRLKVSGERPFAAEVTDLDGDGALDLAVVNEVSTDVSVFLGNGDGTFQAERVFGVAFGPFFARGIAAGDFNRDGARDLAVTTFTQVDGVVVGGDVRIFLGDGNGNFFFFNRIPTAPGARAVVVADFFEDGADDLAVTNADNNSVSILLGLGDGRFVPAGDPLPVGLAPFQLLARDFNDDRHVDVVVANANSDTISVLLGKGDGSFLDGGKFSTFSSGAVALATDDFDRDGDLDVAVAHSDSNALVVMRNRGNGAFDFGGFLTTDEAPFSVAAADYDRDGKVDLITGDQSAQRFSVFLGNGDGSFRSVSRFSLGAGAYDVLGGDFTGDGIPDVVAANPAQDDVTLLVGVGDGTFREGGRFAVGNEPFNLLAVDLNGDGRLDAITANLSSDNVSVLLADGAGGFLPARPFATGDGPAGLAAGDFDGNDVIDLAVTGGISDDVTILLGDGTGGFTRAGAFAVGDSPEGVAVGLFDADRHLDLAVANIGSGDVTVLLGDGTGFFRTQVTVPTGGFSRAVVAADFDGDGQTDLALLAANDARVVLLRGDGSGGFAVAGSFGVGFSPTQLRSADVNGDELLDLVTSNLESSDITVLLGDGRGGFAVPARLRAGAKPWAVALADFDQDGRTDLVSSDPFAATVRFFAGLGDGTFRPQTADRVGGAPNAVASADFDGDGLPDLATANFASDDVSVLLSGGDGTFRPAGSFAVGDGPLRLVTADFNADGRADLATANLSSNDVSILLGNGDGSFHAAGTDLAAGRPQDLVVADFDRDGVPDLALANFDGPVSLLLGNGDGSFRDGGQFDSFLNPIYLVAADFNGDGRPDLAAGTPFADTIGAGANDLAIVFFNQEDSTFAFGGAAFAGAGTVHAAAGDFNADGRADLVTANKGSNDVSVFLGDGAGSFTRLRSVASGARPVFVTVADVNGDGRDDVVSSDSAFNTVTVFLSNPNGSLRSAGALAAGVFPNGATVGDYDGDGVPDLAAVNRISGDVSVFLGAGAGIFFPADAGAIPRRATPLVGDFTPGEAGESEPVRDVAVLGRDGLLLLRRGVAGRPGVFQPPVVVNLDGPARAAVAFRRVVPPPAAVASAASGGDGAGAGGGRLEFATLAAPGAGGSAGVALSFYAFDPRTGLFAGSDGPVVPAVGGAPRTPLHREAGDVDGDGRDDLVVATRTLGVFNEILVFLQDERGGFPRDPSLLAMVGSTPSDVELVDLDGDGRQDVVVANQFSGDVSVLLGSSGPAFAAEQRFRAGTGLYGLDRLIDVSVVPLTARSLAGTVALASGRVDGDGSADAIVLNRGAKTGTVLLGDGRGGLFNPSTELTFPAGGDPTGVAAADFDRDGRLDVAVLDRDANQVRVFLRDPTGGFGRPALLDVDPTSTGLSVADLVGADGGATDGRPDLVVGNDFGDVLVLVGQADGSFEELRLRGQRVSFVTTDMDGDGFRTDVVSADEAADRVEALRRQAGSDTFAATGFVLDSNSGVRGPQNIEQVDLNADGRLDQIFVNSSSNTVQILLQRADRSFAAPRTFFVGTNPAGVTVAQLNDDNGDGVVDGRDFVDVLVANRGSNDVTVLFGAGAGEAWDLTPGPRLAAGPGPVGVQVRDVDIAALTRTAAAPARDSIPDLLVTNGDGSVTLLPGIGVANSGAGTGFFRDLAPARLNPIAQPVVQVLVQPDATLVVTDIGAVFRLDLGNAAAPVQPVFGSVAGSEVRFLAPFNGGFFAARADNSISLLGFNAAGALVDTTGPIADARLTDLSTLQPVINADGRLEVYATNAGNGVPVVLDLGPPEDLLVVDGGLGVLVPGGGAGGGGTQAAAVAALDNFRVIATLTLGPLREGVEGDEGQAGEGGEAVARAAAEADANGRPPAQGGSDLGSASTFWRDAIGAVDRVFEEVAETVGPPAEVIGEAALAAAAPVAGGVSRMLEALRVEVPEVPLSIEELPGEVVDALAGALRATFDEVARRAGAPADLVGQRAPDAPPGERTEGSSVESPAPQPGEVPVDAAAEAGLPATDAPPADGKAPAVPEDRRPSFGEWLAATAAVGGSLGMWHRGRAADRRRFRDEK